MTSEATWRATLQEVKRQGLLHLSAALESGGSEDTSNGGWVTVEAPELRNADWSERWPQQQWQVAFEILFCQMPTSTINLRPHQDDLLFFVNGGPLGALPAAAAEGSSRGGCTGRSGGPLFVRRRSRQLPEELQIGGARAGSVDWRASVLLNLVLQTAYCLAVATCRHADLAQLVDRNGPSIPASAGAATSASRSVHEDVSRDNSSSGGSMGDSSSGRGRGRGSSIREVCKVVYASPSRVHISLDSSRGSSQNPATCYPDIAFAVEDFDHAFSSVVLTEPDDCYCVLLYAEARDSWCLGGGCSNADSSGTSSSQGAVGAVAGAASAGPASAAATDIAPGLPSTDAVAGRLAGLHLRSSGEEAAALAAVPQDEQQQQREPQQGGRGLPPGGVTSGQQTGGIPLVFSGFVNHQLLADAMAPKLRGGLLSGGGWAQRTSRVLMRGPGGLGGADVAVTSLPSANTCEEDPDRRTGRRGPFFSKIAKGIVEAARRATASGGGAEKEGGIGLKCALMTLMVPVDQLAASILEVV